MKPRSGIIVQDFSSSAVQTLALTGLLRGEPALSIEQRLTNEGFHPVDVAAGLQDANVELRKLDRSIHVLLDNEGF